MPSGSRSIIVSGGIQSAPPFTLGAIPMVSNVAPDVLSDSIMSQIGVAPNERIIVGTDPPDAAGSTTLIRMAGIGPWYPGGSAVDTILIGRDVSMTGAAPQQVMIGVFDGIIATGGNAVNTNNVCVGVNNRADDAGLTGMTGNTAIGTTCQVLDQASNNVLVGVNLTVSLQNSNCVIIGNTNTRTGASIGSLVAIGNGTNVGGRGICIGDRANATGGDAVGIGQQVLATGSQAVAVGRIASASANSSVALGAAATCAHNESVALGHNAGTTAANQIVIGGISAAEINTIIIGAGDLPNQDPVFVNLTIRTSNIPSGVTSDLSGASITIATGTGLGDAPGGELFVVVPIITVSGTAVQATVTGLQVDESTTALDTFLSIFDVDNATLERVSVGSAGSGGVGFKLLRIPN